MLCQLLPFLVKINAATFKDIMTNYSQSIRKAVSATIDGTNIDGLDLRYVCLNLKTLFTWCFYVYYNLTWKMRAINQLQKPLLTEKA